MKAGRELISQTLIERAGNILRARAEARVPPLSEQDLETFENILAGRTDREIAEHMSVDLNETQRSWSTG